MSDVEHGVLLVLLALLASRVVKDLVLSIYEVGVIVTPWTVLRPS